MKSDTSKVTRMGKDAKKASYAIMALNAAQKNALLLSLADALEKSEKEILAANALDLEKAGQAELPASMLARLALDKKSLAGIARDVRAISALADPVGEVLDGRELDSGLSLMRKRVPLGVVAAIYEARPNVTVDVAALCLKTGNAVILRGGKETAHTNEKLVAVIQAVLKKHKLPGQCVQAITDPDRALVTALLHLDEYVDMLIPRGGPGLHKLCREQSRIPVITGGIGVCHIIVESSADQAKALPLIENAKIQRPSACNAVETLLVYRDIAAEFLPKLAKHLVPRGVTLHAGKAALPYYASGKKGTALMKGVVPVEAGDYDKEWLSLDMNVEVVDSFDQALAHIRAHGTNHSDAILTEDMATAERFVAEVDSAALFVNASTRFTDGGQFGLGAEVAISTQKLHARGPMGLDALTTYKWIAVGRYAMRG